MTDRIEVPQFYFSKSTDIYDRAPWSETDLHDLRAAAEHGSTLEEAAGHLCRSGTIGEVAQKAEEMGLKLRREQSEPPPR
jgi:hypothetical protein